MRYFPEPHSHIRDKVKVLLDLSNYATNKELEHVTRVDTSDLAVTKDFIILKAEVGKLEINKLVKAPTGLNDLKTRLHDLDVGKLKIFTRDLEKFNGVVDKEVVKKGSS